MKIFNEYIIKKIVLIYNINYFIDLGFSGYFNRTL